VFVTIRLFARLREMAGAPEVRLELPDAASVGDAWTALTRMVAGMDAYGPTVSCAVNEDYARMSSPLHEGDEVAFLPPVSGG
jgi:molybdopterin converting factor subunit 1